MLGDPDEIGRQRGKHAVTDRDASRGTSDRPTDPIRAALFLRNRSRRLRGQDFCSGFRQEKNLRRESAIPVHTRTMLPAETIPAMV